MSKYFYTGVSLAAAFGLMTVAGAAEAREQTSERCVAVTESQVDGLFTAFNDGFQTRDPDAMVRLFADDATLLPTVSGRMRTDAAGIRDYFVSFLASRPFGTVTESETMLGCNMATRVGNWTVRLTDPTSGETSEVAARFSFVYTYDDGAWKIAHLHSSMRPAN